ncbi:Sir2 family NAD-dependent protein deacetylase, partial [Mycobacterium kansasii]
EVAWQDYLQSPYHESDGGWLRPDVVLYEEGLNQVNVQRAVAAMQTADLVVIVGTSMRVYPFAGLLDYRAPQAQVVAINQESLNLG